MHVDLPHIMSRNGGKEIEIMIAGTPDILAKSDMKEIGSTDVGLDLVLLLQESLYSLPSMFLALPILLDMCRFLKLLDPRRWRRWLRRNLLLKSRGKEQLGLRN
jgi:hypothetical protein